MTSGVAWWQTTRSKPIESGLLGIDLPLPRTCSCRCERPTSPHARHEQRLVSQVGEPGERTDRHFLLGHVSHLRVCPWDHVKSSFPILRTPSIACDGLHLDARTDRVARTGAPGGEQRRGRLRPAQRFVDQWLLEGVRQRDGGAGLDRHDVAEGVRRWRTTADRAVDRRRGDDQGRRSDRRDVVRRSADGAVADHLRTTRPAGRVPPEDPVG